ncbi:hypothetical protein CJ030_MR0G005505 [Morella rubra]|uniref:Uncharacterized protein n=1 Tax=Morella rubra TaxID=262757 RepID=A0A6A1ULA1_9ROSI|nr:hypothetical protein CJ030_MR0G005505 [Morella rubra]
MKRRQDLRTRKRGQDRRTWKAYQENESVSLFVDFSNFNMIPLSSHDINLHLHVTDDTKTRHHATSISNSDEESCDDSEDSDSSEESDSNYYTGGKCLRCDSSARFVGASDQTGTKAAATLANATVTTSNGANKNLPSPALVFEAPRRVVVRDDFNLDYDRPKDRNNCDVYDEHSDICGENREGICGENREEVCGDHEDIEGKGNTDNDDEENLRDGGEKTKGHRRSFRHRARNSANNKSGKDEEGFNYGTDLSEFNDPETTDADAYKDTKSPRCCRSDITI